MLKKYNNIENEIGIDEAGRGPLIGRVYAGAVVWPIDLDGSNIIKDSKKLSPKKRKIALEWIKKNIPIWSYGYSEAEDIDSMNILEATKLAMQRAIDKIGDNYSLIIDGVGWEKKFKTYNTTSIPQGDSKYYSIAAASIIAKEYHDEYIRELCKDNLDLDVKYGLLSNMGYGTKKHLEGIKLHGISSFHRKSFKCCQL
jgi:ribonuclease HII